jgi:hypothetical protein
MLASLPSTVVFLLTWGLTAGVFFCGRAFGLQGYPDSPGFATG